MNQIDITNLIAQRKLFHNEFINVYPTLLPLEEIKFWKENNRTIFTFERLRRREKKELEEISIEEITEFIAEQDIHKLQILADSIKRNGVQVPLVIRDDGKLLDGNRRYFACQLLKIQSKAPPDFLSEIPALIIKNSDLTHTQELKILAEANFIPDLKVSWPLDAQARAVEDYFDDIKNKHSNEDSAIDEIVSTFGITRQRVLDLLHTLKLTKIFINESEDQDDKLRRHEIVEEKFVYFWEFMNKAMKGRGKFENLQELEEVREMFFSLIGKGRDSPIKNVKQIEPLVQAKKNETAWSILQESQGSKLAVVVSMINDKKEIRKAEDKIRIFLAWLKEENEFSPQAKNLLNKVIELSQEKLKG